MESYWELPYKYTLVSDITAELGKKKKTTHKKITKDVLVNSKAKLQITSLYCESYY